MMLRKGNHRRMDDLAKSCPWGLQKYCKHSFSNEEALQLLKHIRIV